ncbi:hypothetical protein DL764_006002 [Monosporascus ibericus]|uniref:Ecp2 effector protein domain-containing protein n=1 Tax=Monosporascus ibericus TaxID=155417 RepID=A0A4Q4T9W8_9PEZI|nr:hypothetical protein DL764_006002 [Monosporascus ibericus]
MTFTILALLLLPPGARAAPIEKSCTRTTWAAILAPRNNDAALVRFEHGAATLRHLDRTRPHRHGRGEPHGAMAPPPGARGSGLAVKDAYTTDVGGWEVDDSRTTLCEHMGNTGKALRLKDNLRCTGVVDLSGWLRDLEGISKARCANRDAVV